MAATFTVTPPDPVTPKAQVVLGQIDSPNRSGWVRVKVDEEKEIRINNVLISLSPGAYRVPPLIAAHLAGAGG